MENKVLICIPTRGTIYYKVANFIAKQAEMGYPSLYSSSSYGTEAARKKLTNTFMRFDYTHLFFLDDDVLPPNDVIARLLNANAPVVTADYNMMQDGEISSHCSIEGSRFTGKEEGLIKIDACGLGACLIQRDVIAKCKDDFGFKFDKDGEVIQSEDYWFCEKVIAKGFNIFCDFDIKCAHYKMIPLGR